MNAFHNNIYLNAPREYKDWVFNELVKMQVKQARQKQHEINLVKSFEVQSTKIDLSSVIHMHWNKPDLSDIERVTKRGRKYK